MSIESDYSNVWIFQANPDRFDLDGYLGQGPDEILFLVNQSYNRMALGDQVYIWRAAGRQKAVSGIVAEARIVELPRERSDLGAAKPFWFDSSEADVLRRRALLRVVRVASSRTMVKRDWLVDDPIMNDLSVIRFSNATNFAVDPEHRERLSDLWRVTGQDWDYADAVAGLWAYNKTYGGPLSKGFDSTVAEVALRIGRAVTGVYNKVLNFRALDPRDTRAGLPAGGEATEAVWARFYLQGEQRVDVGALEAEFAWLWGSPATTGSPSEAGQEIVAGEAEVSRLTRMSLEELLAKLHARFSARAGNRTPKSHAALTRIFERDPLLVAIVKLHAEFKCEVPRCDHPIFISSMGHPYCEVHHIDALADGGFDTLENLICLCPAHHIEAHLGARRKSLDAIFREVRRAVQINRGLSAVVDV